LKRELERFENSEARLQELTERMRDVGESNQLLSLELEDKKTRLHSALEELASLQTSMLRLTEQTAADSSSLAVQNERVASLEREVQYLSQRQVMLNCSLAANYLNG